MSEGHKEVTRDEAFGAVCDAMTALQRRGGVLTMEERRVLDRLIIAYGSAAAREARELSWQLLRPARVVRKVDGVEWLEDAPP